MCKTTAQSTRDIKDHFQWNLTVLSGKEKEKGKARKEKVKVTETQEKEKGSEDLAADAEEEKDAGAEKEEARVEQGKGKFVRQVGEKGYGGKGNSSGKGKGPVCYNCGRPGHIASERYSNQGKGKGKSVRNVQGDYESWNQDGDNWNDKWQNWHSNDGQQQQQPQQQASSSSQRNVSMVRQAQGNESIRRVTQESLLRLKKLKMK